DSTYDLDADVTAFPQPFSKMAPGRYAVQAVLDQNHTYNYIGRGPGDLVSAVAELDLPAGGELVLKEAVAPSGDPWAAGANDKPEMAALLAKGKEEIKIFDFTSPALTNFWGRPTHIRAWIVTPPDYAAHPKLHYPTVYYTHGFGGTLDRLTRRAADIRDRMEKGQFPPMIWVMLDESLPTGTHEFADSVNNGPWGEALTREFIPALEKTYRMDNRAGGRFLNGHSSGGWATLWLQTRYPSVFGGTWSTSPDPSDFHDWTGVDLYAAGANIYRKPDGSPYPIMRDKGQIQATLEEFGKMEAVLGDYGGQLGSFDWVFSPKGEDGRPVPMFDRVTGAVDPAVVAYWRDHFDIAYRVTKDWPALKKDLDGKIHLYVGTADTFYLDGSAHRLEAALRSVGAKATFAYLPDRTHFDLYKVGDDRFGLMGQFAWEMYGIARPGAKH
ncbi:MAG TPA: alpha/beta hydrolase-fold protein, partial [Magnetospirillaceae bacterium]|nr:alpha/beta hydrolase-fold protein [Magnetospirillaceae bacterium]